MKRTALVPDVLSELRELCGPAPVLSVEEEEDYKKLALKVIDAIDPTDAIELLFANDVIYYSFEIRRLRLIKIGLMQNDDFAWNDSGAEKEVDEDQSQDDDDGEEESEDARRFGEHRERATRDAVTFLRCSRNIEAVDRLESSAIAKLSAALARIDIRRVNLRERLRQASNEALADVQHSPATVGVKAIARQQKPVDGRAAPALNRGASRKAN